MPLCLIKHSTMKVYGGIKVQLHEILLSKSGAKAAAVLTCIREVCPLNLVRNIYCPDRDTVVFLSPSRHDMVYLDEVPTVLFRILFHSLYDLTYRQRHKINAAQQSYTGVNVIFLFFVFCWLYNHSRVSACSAIRFHSYLHLASFFRR